MWRVAVLAALLLSACVEPGGVDADLPPGYPPKMGTIAGTLGGTAVTWETFDFSVGAFDASAWAESDGDSKQVSAHLMGYLPARPREMTGRLVVSGDFGKALRKGEAAAVTVSILRGKEIVGARLSSDGQQAHFVIESIGPKAETSYSRRVTGRVSARLCPVGWPGQTCQDLALRFDTEMQVDSNLPIAP